MRGDWRGARSSRDCAGRGGLAGIEAGPSGVACLRRFPAALMPGVLGAGVCCCLLLLALDLLLLFFAFASGGRAEEIICQPSSTIARQHKSQEWCFFWSFICLSRPVSPSRRPGLAASRRALSPPRAAVSAHGRGRARRPKDLPPGRANGQRQCRRGVRSARNRCPHATAPWPIAAPSRAAARRNADCARPALPTRFVTV